MGKVSDYLIRISLTLLLLFSAPANLVLAADVLSEGIDVAQADKSSTEDSKDTDRQDVLISSKIQKEIKDAIEEIYGKKDSEEIFEHVMRIAQKAIKERSASLKYADLHRADDWYKDEIIYMFYIDQFGERSWCYHITNASVCGFSYAGCRV